MKNFERYSKSVKFGSGIVYRKPVGRPSFRGKPAPKPRKGTASILLICDKMSERTLKNYGTRGRSITKKHNKFTDIFPQYAGGKIMLKSPFPSSFAKLPFPVQCWLMTNLYVKRDEIGPTAYKKLKKIMTG